MRAVIRRLRNLEEMLIPQVDLERQRLADLLWERRQRRLEASGQSIEKEELDCGSLGLPPGTRLNNRETLRLALQLRRERSRQVQSARESESGDIRPPA